MPETVASNYVVYAVARDHYLKYLLDAGKITAEQHEKMDRYLHDRFNIADIEKYTKPDDLIQAIKPENIATPEVNSDIAGPCGSYKVSMSMCGVVLTVWTTVQNIVINPNRYMKARCMKRSCRV